MKDFRSCMESLMKAMRPLRWKVAVSILIGIVGVCTSLTFVWASKRVVDIATGALDAPLLRNVFMLAGVMLLQVIIVVTERWWDGLINVEAQNSRRLGAFARVMGSTWSGREKFHSGDTVNRLEEDIRVSTDFVCSSIPSVVITLFQLVAAAGYIFYLQPRLAWILVLIMPVAVLGSKLYFKKMRQLTTEIRAGDSRIQGYVQENIQHRVLIKMLGGTSKLLEKLGGMQDEVKAKTVQRLNYGAISRGFMSIGFRAGYALVFFWGVFGLKAGTVTYGMMVAFLQLVGQVQRPVASLAMQIPAFIKALASEERLLELEEMPQEDESTRIQLEGAPGVLVEDLCFAYIDGGRQVINGLNFDFKPGTLTTILGPTGAGKSTLVKIVMSLLAPESGRITLYSGRDSHESCVATRCNFMYVPQGNSLMSGTIRQNLLMANPGAGEEEIKDALHLAAADFVYGLPEGLETVCAEVGSGLSEGQAQRIAIARALLRPGGILVLDEATSALDQQTEQELLRRLAERYHGSKTILCVTHRPAASTYADAVLTLG